MGEAVSPTLAPLLGRVYEEVQGEPVNLRGIRAALLELLAFLASPTGRTDANCHVTDGFFGVPDAWDRYWDHLPDDFQEIFADLGGILHDTVSSPAIAANFESTPEQLLERVLRVQVP